MYYADITVTGQYGLVFLDSLFDGRPFSFYDNALASGIAPEGAVYDIGTYVIFGIWSLPVWLLNHFAGVSALSVGSLLWFKLLVILFFAGTLVWMKKIAEKLFPGQSGLAENVTFLYAVSLYSFFPVFTAVQYDVISLFFLLMGLYYYILDDDSGKGSFRWLLPVAVSTTIKPMTLLVLLLLVVRKEKNLLTIVVRMIEGMALLFVCKLLYFRNAGYQSSAGSFLSRSMESLFAARITTSLGDISIFVIVLAGIYIWAYLEKNKDARLTILMIAGTWTSFQMLGGMTCYWVVYLAPFLALAVGMAEKSKRNSTYLIELVAELCMTMVYILHFSWVYGGEKTYSYLLLKPWYQRVQERKGTIHTAAGLLRSFNVNSYISAVYALALACTAAVLIMAWKNMSRRNEKEAVTESFSTSENVTPWIWRGHLLIIGGFCIYTLAALVVAI